MMKKIFLLVAFFVLGKMWSYAQYPITQNIGADSTIVVSKGALQSRLINMLFTDTAQANTQRIRQYAGAQIATTTGGNLNLWVRNATATAWLPINTGSGNNIYTIDGTLLGNRTLTGAGYSLTFNQLSKLLFNADSTTINTDQATILNNGVSTLNVKGATGRIFLMDTTAPADERIYELKSSNGEFYISILNDAQTTNDSAFLITSASRVGINTLNPDSTLKVGGGVNILGGLRVGDLPTSPGTKQLRINAQGQFSVTDTLIDAGGTVTSVGTNNGSGITGGPITTTGTLAIDTTNVIATKASVSGGLAGKLNLSDTAAMLAPYLRAIDTASLSNRINTKLNISDTATMLGNYLNNVGYGLSKAGQVASADSATLSAYYLRRKDSLTVTNPLGYVTQKILADTAAAIRSSDLGGTVTSVATNNGTGITGGTITTSGTLAIDTTVISTRAWRQKGVDSLQANINLKLNISDTASMLNPYLRKVDTASLSNRINQKLNISDTASMLTNYVNNVGYGLSKAGQVVSADSATLSAYYLRRKDSLTTTNPLGYVTRKILADTAAAIRSADAGGTVTSVATNNGTGITGGTITTSGTLAIDTLLISTRAWRQKGIDSVAALANTKISGSLISGYLTKATGTLTVDTSQIYQNNGNIGIGTISPASGYKVDMVGSLRVGNGSSYNKLTINGNTVGSYLNFQKNGTNKGDIGPYSAVLGGVPPYSGSNDDLTYSSVGGHFFNTNAGVKMYLNNAGNLGLSASPDSMLTVLEGAYFQRGVRMSGLPSAPGTRALRINANGTLSVADTLVDAGGTVTSVATNNGTGITGGTITTTGTLAIDTLLISTRAWRQKGVDSLQANINQKLNISDTASMLSPYLRTNVAAATYVPQTRTITINGTSQDLSANRTYNVGTVTSVATNTGTGITGGTITSSGTIAADTLLLSTRAWRQKGIDSVAALINSNVSGTTNYVAKFTGTNTIGNSQLFDNGTNVGIGTTSPGSKLQVNSVAGNYGIVNTNGTVSVGTYIEASNSYASFGTSSNHPLGFFTNNNAPQMYITTAGNVGIGTTSPGTRLVVQQSADNAIGFSVTNPTGRASVFGYSSTFQLDIGSSTNDNIRYGNFGVGSGVLSFLNNGSEAMRITSGGDLLVGTTSGTSRIQAVGKANEWVADLQASTTPGQSYGLVIRAGTSSGDFPFYVLSADNSTAFMAIKGNGNVGIGTTSPTVSGLTVSRTGDSYVRVQGGSATYTGLDLLQGVDGVGYLWNRDNTAILFGTNNTERMRLTAGGNLLVGTTTDAGYKLDVNGTGRFSASYSASGSVAIETWQRIGGAVSADITYNDANTSMNFGTNTPHSLNLKTNNNTALTITSGGNVGIGTTSPDNKLSVRNEASSAIAVIDVRGGVGGAGAVAISGNGTTLTSTSFDLIQNSAGAFVFQRDNNPLVFGTNNTEQMRITSGGALLVGTTSNPYSLGALVVNHNSSLTRTYFQRGVDLIEIVPSDGTQPNQISSSYTISGSGYKPLSISARQNQADLYLTTGGLVGIGTTSPSYKLEVNLGAGNSGIIARFNAPSYDEVNISAGLSNWIGTNSTSSFSLRSNNTDRLTVHGTTGNVLIGTTTDAGYKLDVSGTARITSNLLAQKVQVGTAATINDAAGVANTLQFANYTAGTFITGSADNYIYKTSNVIGTLSAQTLIFQTRSDVAGGGFAFVSGATPSVIANISSNGAVRFNVYGSGSFTGTRAYDLSVDASGNIIEVPVGAGTITGSGTTNYIPKFTSSSAIGNSIVQDYGDNVWVGTNTSGYGTLNIQRFVSAPYATLTLTDQATPANEVGIYLRSNGSNPVGISSAGAPIAFYTGGPASNERMRLTSGGNLILGTTGDIGVKLSVSDGTVFTGFLPYAAGSAAVTGTWSNHAFVTYTNGTERMRIATTGAVRLNAYGSGSFTGTPAYNLSVDASGNIIETPGSVISGTGTTNYIPKFTSSSAIGNSLLSESGSDVTLNGNSTNAQFIITNTNSSYLSLQSYFQDAYINMSGTGNLIWRMGGSFLERMRLTSGGSLGIGTSSPNIAGVDVGLTINGSSNSILEVNYGGTRGGFLFANSSNVVLSSVQNLPLLFNTANIERMRLDASGNLIVGGSTVNVVGLNVQTAGTLITGTAYVNINAAVGGNALSIGADATRQAGVITGYKGIDFYTYNTGWSRSLTLDYLGNLGLGVTPSAFQNASIQLPNGGILASAREYINIVANAYYTSNTFYYTASGYQASWYQQGAGEHKWYNAPSGTAGNAISFTQAMTLFSTGNLAVGGTSDNGSRLNVTGAATFSSSVTAVGLASTGTNHLYNGVELRFYNANNTNWGTIKGSSGTSFGTISITGGSGNGIFVDNSGNVGIGSTSPTYDLTLSKSVASGNVILNIENTSTTGSARLWFGNNASSSGARIQYFGATHAARPNLFSIGTDAANDMMFETSGSERMRITSGGNVGIGTTSPGYLLELNSTTSSKLSLNGGTSQNGIRFEAITGVNAFYLFNGTLDTGGFGIYDNTNSAARLWVNNSGNVGIGTSSPTLGKLQVNAGGNEVVGFFGSSGMTSNQSNYLQIGKNQAVGNNAGEVSFKYVGDNNASNMVSLGFYGNGQLLNILPNGNVGIGTTSPDTKLQVEGGTLRISGTRTAGSFLDISADNTGSNGVELGVSYYGSGSYGPLRLTTGGSERMRITSGGNVLVGTTTDAGYKFDVAGSLRNTTSAYFATSSGSVGIGTTSPDASTKLQVESSSSSSLRVVSSAASGGDLYITSVNGSGESKIDKQGAAGPLTFYNNGSERMRLTSSGELLINTTTDAGAYYLQVNGDVYASAYYESSDLRLKNVLSERKGSDGINTIAFKWKDGRDSLTHIGYAAQQVEKVLPDAVKTNPNGYKTINYDEVQSLKIANLEQEIAELKKIIKQLIDKK